MEQRGVTSGPVSQKEAVSSPTMPPKKGIWTTVLWIFFSLPQLLQLLSSVLHCLLLPSFSSHY